MPPGGASLSGGRDDDRADGRFDATTRDQASLPHLAAVEHAQHEDGGAIVVILKGVRSTKHLKDELAVLVSISQGSPQLRASPEDVSPDNQLFGNTDSQAGEVVVKEGGKPIEVGEGVERPLDGYWPGHRRKRAVPQVRSHCTTRS